MKYSKMMYVISPDDWEKMKKNGEPSISEDIEMNKHNESMLQNKILAQHEKDKQWKQYGNKMEEIIAQGVDRSKLANPPPVIQPSSSPISPPVGAPENETSFIREGVGAKSVAKISRLYYLLQKQPGVVIDKVGLSLDGNYIGPTLEILKQLVFNNRHLRFQLEPLLERIAPNPTIVKLIGNMQAKEYLQIIEGMTPAAQATSTPARGMPSPRVADSMEQSSLFGNLRDLEEEEEVGEEEEGARGPRPKKNKKKTPRKGSGIKKKKNPPKKGAKLKSSWKSLF